MLSLVAVGFNFVVCFGVPLAVLIWCIARRRHLVLPFLAGLMAFLVSQNLIRIPLLGLLGRQMWFVLLRTAHPLAYGLTLAFTAGLFEEVGRYIAMRLMARWATAPEKRLSFPGALAFGLGHGGFEAAYIGTLYLQQIMGVSASLIALSNPLAVALPGIERLLTLLVHVGLSVMVMRGAAQASRKSRLLWLLAAILAHAAVDAGVVLPLWGVTNTWLIEAWVLAAAVLLTAFTVLSRRKISYQPGPRAGAPTPTEPEAHQGGNP